MTLFDWFPVFLKGKRNPISAMLADEGEEEDYLDQIEELTHKLFVAENQIKALQQGNQLVSYWLLSQHGTH